jgi:hypothetical protein
VLPVSIVIGRDDRITGNVFVGVYVCFAHGPNLMINDLIVQAGRYCNCS